MLDFIKKLFKKKEIKPIPVEYTPPQEPVKYKKTAQQIAIESHYEKKRHLRKIKNRIARLSRRENRRGK